MPITAPPYNAISPGMAGYATFGRRQRQISLGVAYHTLQLTLRSTLEGNIAANPALKPSRDVSSNKESIVLTHFASIALAASLTMGTVLAAAVPATAMPLANSPSPSVSDVILVQEHGSRRNQDWYEGRRYWRDRHYHHRYWNDSRWDRRRYWDDDWRYRRYHHRHGGIYFEIR
jgi:hypothetical protein